MEAKTELTVAESLGWLNYTFSRTENSAAAVPEDLLDWRPEDPSGAFQFSLAEIVMHVADARRMFVSQLTGVDESPRYWSKAYWSPTADEADVYKFEAYAGKQALLDSLKAARELYAPYLAMPASSLMLSPASARPAFERMLAEYTAAGQDMTPLERQGPPTVYQVLFMAAVHESGHRGALHTLLRVKGANPPDV